VTNSEPLSWFAVRCVFRQGWPSDAEAAYEERITLWQALSAEAAIERAEQEALEYAATMGDTQDEYLGLAQAYQLFDAPEDGAELFSLIRDSPLSPEDYLSTYFDTGTEHQRTAGE
jgi:hypothetical protein